MRFETLQSIFFGGRTVVNVRFCRVVDDLGYFQSGFPQWPVQQKRCQGSPYVVSVKIKFLPRNVFVPEVQTFPRQIIFEKIQLK